MPSIRDVGPFRAFRRALGACLFASTGLVGALVAQPAPGLVVRKLEFEGNKALSEEVLAASIATTRSNWFATTPVIRKVGLGEKRYLNEQEFRRDVLRLVLLYRRSGFLEVEVDTAVRRTEEDAYVTFRITEGAPVRVTAIVVDGLAAVGDRERLLEDLPLQVGDPFDRLLLQATADTLVRRLRDRGRPGARVFSGFDVDRAGRTAAVSLEAEPGDSVAVGPIAVTGVRRVDSSLVRDLLATRPGRPFSQKDLQASQVSLYTSELFRFASVDVDSAWTPGSGPVPLRVQVTEGRFHQVRAFGGYGTDDCLRMGAGYTERNILGEGRILDLNLRFSKLGVGEPTRVEGIATSICGPIEDDSIGSGKLNFSATLGIRRPAFLSYRNVGTATLFAERRSEVRVYRREELGFSLGLSRQLWNRFPFSVQYRLGYGRTEALPATYCANFNACTPDDITQFQQRRLLGVASVNTTLNRTNNPLDPSRGTLSSFEVAHSSGITGSSDLQYFTRGVADASWYRPLGRNTVLALRARAGYVYAPQVAFDSGAVAYVPPEQRFYAGGPNDVRGFERNELGPVVYVIDDEDLPPDPDDIDPADLRFAATGGNTLFVANAELRLPAPVFRGRLRLALFVDAGGVWQLGIDDAPKSDFRVTPGFGVRIATPLGPARLDVGYNPYRRQSGALYRETTTGELILVTPDFSAPKRRDYTIHFAVGHPF
ncbi:MAG TPA: BamA/TamA family outer membrane protein [Gemmatimonadales bacterium]|nr:BamA/TamA family outer membrane protein [Gemmatimonadales bacterium]